MAFEAVPFFACNKKDVGSYSRDRFLFLFLEKDGTITLWNGLQA